jgi:hypothetical protein
LGENVFPQKICVQKVTKLYKEKIKIKQLQLFCFRLGMGEVKTEVTWNLFCHRTSLEYNLLIAFEEFIR